jgi:DDE_Tnp_1-associated
MAIERLVGHFGTLVDPRCRGKVEHRLTDILVIAVCAVIACAESWNDIALYGRSKLAWLRIFLELPNGIPSHDSFRRVFMLIGPEAFERTERRLSVKPEFDSKCMVGPDQGL